MQTIENYLQHAAECRQLAARARTSEDREMILKMVETWEELAAAREKMLKSRERAQSLVETGAVEQLNKTASASSVVVAPHKDAAIETAIEQPQINDPEKQDA